MPRAYGELRKKLENERPGYGNHMADDATAVFEQTRNLSLREGLGDSLRLVDEALTRFEDGTCEDCGRAIEWGRLKTLAYTGLCVECVRRHERES